MPDSTFVPILSEGQAQMLAALRRAQYGYLLAVPAGPRRDHAEYRPPGGTNLRPAVLRALAGRWWL
jgi:hypothetical protein